jgi:predicted HicB family RNase H-like nuclease
MPNPLTPAERQSRARSKRTKSGLVRLDLAIPRKLHRALRTRSRRADMSVSAMVIGMLEAMIST